MQENAFENVIFEMVAICLSLNVLMYHKEFRCNNAVFLKHNVIQTNLLKSSF